jgi:DNA (cytosine-5)-methyltransferase 1
MPKSGELSLRRLTPLESERLQGWPDAHTASSYDGTPISDKQRYKMIGNGIAVPCAAWVAKRIAQYDNTLPDLVL